MAVSTINPLIPVANSVLASAPVRSQFQAAANDINAIYGLINAYPVIVQKSPNMIINSAGQMQRSSYGIPITLTKIWSLVAHDGVSPFYSSIIYVANFVSPTYSGPALVFQGYDWFVYVVNATTGVPLTGWPQALTGPCYGRCQAFDVNSDGFTEVFAATHGNTVGSTGKINAFNSDGSALWSAFNVYQDEGFNDGNFGITGIGPTTLSAAITTVGQTAITVASAAGFPTTAPFDIQIEGECMIVTAGAGTTSWTVLRGQYGTTAATHLISTNVYGGHQTVGGTTTTGGSTASATSTSLTVSGTNPHWPTNAWQRVNGVGFGATLKIVAGTGVGQIREITSVTSGNVLGVAAWGVTPDATSKWQILPRYTSDAYFQHAGTLNLETAVWYLYTTADDNTIVKRNATTGAKIWRYWADENNEPYPLIKDVNGDGIPEVMFNSVDGYTYALEIGGTLLWKNLGVAGVGLDAFLDAADVNADGIQEVLVNQRRSGNGAAGRMQILKGTTGVPICQSTDQLGDMDSKPLPVPRNDGSGLIDIFCVGDAGFPVMYDYNAVGLWSDDRAPIAYNSSPVLCDVNYDGVNEILVCNSQGGILIYSSTGVRLGNFTIPSRLGSTQVGIEGIPLIQDINGDGLLEFVIPSIDGNVYCYQFQKNAG